MDPFALLLTITFFVGVFLLIPLDRWLNQQRAKRRRTQAHIQRRKAGRW